MWNMTLKPQEIYFLNNQIVRPFRKFCLQKFGSHTTTTTDAILQKLRLSFLAFRIFGSSYYHFSVIQPAMWFLLFILFNKHTFLRAFCSKTS